MDWLIQLVVAGVGYLATDTAVQAYTGKHIHEHVYAWWRNIMDKIVNFLHQNPNIYAQHTLLQVVDRFGCLVDMTKVAMDKVLKIETGVIDQYGNFYKVSEEHISKEELCELFPSATEENQIVEVLQM